MKKETLLLHHIMQDLKIVARFQMSNAADWRLSFIIPVTLLSVIFGWLFKNIWIGLFIFSVAAYHIVRYVIECKDYFAKKKVMMESFDRADISISVERFSHLADETIYEPHRIGNRGYTTKYVRYYYFASGCKWRIPPVYKHYAWSNEYYVSPKGLENISIEGDEFYFVSLQGYHDIAYIYPCKNFVLDDKLMKQNQTV